VETGEIFDLQQELSDLTSSFSNIVDDFELKIDNRLRAQNISADVQESSAFERAMGGIFATLKRAVSKIESCQSSLSEEASVAAEEVTEQNYKTDGLTYAKLSVDFLATTMSNTVSIMGYICDTFPNMFDDEDECNDVIEPIRLTLTIATASANSVSFGLALALQAYKE
jgi:hypothetical protein